MQIPEGSYWFDNPLTACNVLEYMGEVVMVVAEHKRTTGGRSVGCWAVLSTGLVRAA